MNLNHLKIFNANLNINNTEFKALRNYLNQNNIRFMENKGFQFKNSNNFFIVDFYLPKPLKLCLFKNQPKQKVKMEVEKRRFNIMTISDYLNIEVKAEVKMEVE